MLVYNCKRPNLLRTIRYRVFLVLVFFLFWLVGVRFLALITVAWVLFSPFCEIVICFWF